MTWYASARVLATAPQLLQPGARVETPPRSSLPFNAGAHAVTWPLILPPCSLAAHSQRSQAVQAPEHAAPDGLQLVGGQVQLAH